MRTKVLSADDLPKGFAYQPDFVTAEEEQGLLPIFERLEFRAFNFHGYIAKRRTAQCGIEYDFSSRRANQVEGIPDFLKPYKERAAKWAEVDSNESRSYRLLNTLRERLSAGIEMRLSLA